MVEKRNKAIDIGQKIGVKWSNLKVDPKQMQEGIKTEYEEHGLRKGVNVIGKSKAKAGKIALSHLEEDPQYYTKLKKMEDTPKHEIKRKVIFQHLLGKK
jgi:hypothetical protein